MISEFCGTDQSLSPLAVLPVVEFVNSQGSRSSKDMGGINIQAVLLVIEDIDELIDLKLSYLAAGFLIQHPDHLLHSRRLP